VQHVRGNDQLLQLTRRRRDEKSVSLTLHSSWDPQSPLRSVPTNVGREPFALGPLHGTAP
jgi:hypothetical protein